ncbi:hypothetical protein [Pyrobaculum aerophilum]|nr:hypothetical protein [Pyrobaculum aerophilum]
MDAVIGARAYKHVVAKVGNANLA